MTIPIVCGRGISSLVKSIRLAGIQEGPFKMNLEANLLKNNSKLVSPGSVRFFNSCRSLNTITKPAISNSLNLTFCKVGDRNLSTSTVFSASTTNPPPTGLADEILKAKVAADSAKDAKPAEPSAEEEQKKRENSARAVKFTLIAMGVMSVGAALYMFFVWGSPAKDRHGVEIRDEFSDLPFFEQYYKRAKSEIFTTVTYITDPSREKLLPDPLPPHMQPPYTVILELTGVLVHPDWTYKTGWRFKKRPGVDYFLSNIADYFEVVVYTTELGFTAFPIIDALDKQGVIPCRLFRDSTKYIDGVHMKDLDRINRDLSKVIVIDWNEKAVRDHRDNAIVLPKWKGNDDDRTLFDLVALLKTISANEIHDVRVVLDHYAKFGDPMAEFREKQKLLAQQEIEREALVKEKNVGLSPSWVISMIKKG